MTIILVWATNIKRSKLPDFNIYLTNRPWIVSLKFDIFPENFSFNRKATPSLSHLFALLSYLLSFHWFTPFRNHSNHNEK